MRTRVFFVKSNWSAANQACLAVPLFKLTFQIEILQQRVCQSPGHDDQLSLQYWNYEQDIRAERGNCNSTQNMVVGSAKHLGKVFGHYPHYFSWILP